MTPRHTATADFLIVGGGIVGLTTALALRRRHPDAEIRILEKEGTCGRHASGRNSGVLHAGFYYAADSLKARFTRDGNRALTRYCEERGLPIRRCGKLVVARDASQQPGLDELLRRAHANGVELREVDAVEAGEIEPRARVEGRALFSPATASVDPSRVVSALVDDARRAGIEVSTGTPYLGRSGDRIRTPGGAISAGYVINAAGLHADRIARDFGFSERYRILPFKGLYLYAGPDGPRLNTHIYPVPELRYPFLGVHFTVTADGRTKIGPTAIPAFWREHYEGLANFDAAELLEIARLCTGLFVSDGFGFRRLAWRELRKYSKRRLVRRAFGLLNVSPTAGWRWGPAGVRAQLLDVRERRLEMDFVVEGDDRSLHVLNAVSPAFTCAFPFAEYVADRVDAAMTKDAPAHATRSDGSAARTADARAGHA